MGENEDFESLKSMILLERSLDVNQYKENYLKRRIAVRMRSLNIATYQDYMRCLEKRKEEYVELLDKLTINVTQFFRDPEMFAVLESELFVEYIKQLPKGRKLRIWSAGCSSGEEPYSISMMLQEIKEKQGFKDLDFEIIATDIDEVILRRAFTGEYEERAMENIASQRKLKYFDAAPGGKYLVKQGVKKYVKFSKLNLMNKFAESDFDIIFCRNVTIYFTKELQKTVMENFFSALVKDGILIIGKTETMLFDFRNKFKCINIKERLFKKV